MVETDISDSPDGLLAAFGGHYQKMTEMAPKSFIAACLAKMKNKGMTADVIARACSDAEFQMQKKTEQGAGGFVGFVDDWAQDKLREAAILSSGAKLAVPIITAASPPGGAAALAVAEMIDAARNIGDNLLNMTPVRNFVEEDEHFFKKKATHEQVENYGKLWQHHVRELHSAVKEDPEVAKAAAMLLPDVAAGKPELNGQLGNMVRDHPQFFPVLLQNSVQVDLTVVIDLDELKESLTSEFQLRTSELHEGLKGIREELVTLKDQQKVIVEWVNDQQRRQDAADRAAELELRIQLVWAAAEGGLQMAAGVAGIVDKKLAEDIRRVGGAALNVVKSGMQLVKAANEIGGKGLEVATALGSAAATGNFIGAAFALIGAFAPAGPTPEQIILEEIGALRNEMRDLHQETMERFDRIDQTLNAIYVDVMTKLDTIDVSVGVVDAKTDEVLDDLDRIEATLMRHQLILVNFFQTAQRQMLRETYYAALGRPSDSHTPTMGTDAFVEYRGRFINWAAAESRNNIEVPVDTWNPPPGVPFDTFIAARLDGSPLEHVAFLNHVVSQKSWTAYAPPHNDEPLHNAYTWSLAASGYSELIREWPQLAASTTSKNPDAHRGKVAAPGRQLLAAMQQIPKRDNGDLLEEALSNMQTKYNNYGEQLINAEGEWARGDILPQAVGVAPDAPRPPLWREDPHSDRGYMPRLSVFMEDGSATGFDLPPGAVARIPALFRNASYLDASTGKNNLRVSISSSSYTWKERITTTSPGHGPGKVDDDGVWHPPPDRVHTFIKEWTGTKFWTKVFYRDQPIQQYFLDAERSTKDHLPRIWEVTWRQMIESGKSFGNLARDDGPAVADIQNSLAWLWSEKCYPWLKDQQSGPDVNDSLHVAAIQLNGALRLLDCLLELGLPMARTSDESMRTALDGAPVWAGGVGLFSADQFLVHLDPKGAHPAPAPRYWKFSDHLAEVTREPLALLRSRVQAYQAALESGAYVEFYRDIELTLQRLAVAEDLVELTRMRLELPPNP